ncbi:diguanylate cyclase [Paenibacillus sp.]|uniref:diguanylate cyclase n=1 Tax=Paenibacillus sp. TaxID=58172 RepID=UPI002D38D0A8|nr:diguanylate cyclase [Paenibacillus sp.]HZG58396.1 diguanylate cyclase [Paenibacillus sp.]
MRVPARRLCLLILAFGLFLPWLPGCGLQQRAPQAEGGELFVGADALDAPGTIRLDGEWAFYPGELLTPEDLRSGAFAPRLIRVPMTWNKQAPPYADQPGHGYGTYRLLLRLPAEEAGRIHGLSLYKVHSAYRLWIDGELAIEGGRVGRSAAEWVPASRPRTVFFSPASQEVELVLQASNFSHRNGGLWKSAHFGRDAEVLERLQQQRAVDLLLITCLLLIGVYHLRMYAIRRSERSSLYFGLFSLALALRAACVGEAFLLHAFPGTPYVLHSKLEFISTYLAAPFALLYTRTLFPNEFVVRWTRLFLTITFGLAAVGLVTPESVYSHTYYPFQFVVYAQLTFMIAAIGVASLRGREGARMTLATLLVFTCTVVHDFLFYNQQIQSRDLAPLGVVVFFLSQSFLLMSYYTRTLTSVESLSEQLLELNRTLETKVEERTRDVRESRRKLEEANRKLRELSYLDPLMNIPNRRYFGEAMAKEWKQGRRTGSPLSLVMIDIDAFKPFNDGYGHQAGDSVLLSIAQALRGSLMRPRDLIARYGGEELAVILPETDAEGARAVAEQLRIRVEALRIPHAYSPYGNHVTISLGVCTCIPHADRSIDMLIQYADGALYEAKREGRNRVRSSALP